ncbi:MAG: OmpH family outer membrane protein [Planctomycetes bacterium]|nr:OmpH family outer membrane protein [Planctomycetota bacterium]
MKRFTVVALVLLAVAAGFAGSLIHDAVTKDAEPVHAAKARSKDGGIRVALLNLEEASRQSKKFKERKNDWDAAQKDLKEQGEKLKSSYDAKRAEAAREHANGHDTLDLKVELQSIEEAVKAFQDESKNYLAALLNQYQTEVLREVIKAVEAFAALEGYDIVVQDYTVNAEDADFFSGGAYAQSMMSKPVLAAPGMLTNKNAYVTDITQAIIDKLK